MHLKILHIRDYVELEKDYIARNNYTASSVLVSKDSDSECDTCSRLQGEVLAIIVAAELGRSCSCCCWPHRSELRFLGGGVLLLLSLKGFSPCKWERQTCTASWTRTKYQDMPIRSGSPARANVSITFGFGLQSAICPILQRVNLMPMLTSCNKQSAIKGHFFTWPWRSYWLRDNKEEGRLGTGIWVILWIVSFDSILQIPKFVISSFRIAVEMQKL